jgi:hypothetical protein
MSSTDGNWDELSSGNERLAQLPDSRPSAAQTTAGSSSSHWAELASQSERLADTTDPLYMLASSCQRTSGLRLVTSAA